MKKYFSISGMLVLVFPVMMLVSSCTEEISDTSKGEGLVYQLWDAIRNQDLEGIKNNMAPGFQSVHDFGANNIDAELELLRGVAIADFEITDLKITSNEDDLFIATYFVSVAETINGTRLSKTPAARMTIFVKDDGVWKWVAHANLKPITAEEPEETEEDN